MQCLKKSENALRNAKQNGSVEVGKDEMQARRQIETGMKSEKLRRDAS